VSRTPAYGARGVASPWRWLLVAASLLAVSCAVVAIVLDGGAPSRSGAAVPAAVHHGSRAKNPSRSQKQPVADGALVAWAKVRVLPVYEEPAGRPVASLANPNDLGAPLVMLVASVRGSWVEVYLPQRPNESLGWTPAGDMTTVRDPDRIVVDLDRRHIELIRGSEVVFQSTAAVGSPESPTPTGYFYVTEVLKLTDPDTAYGPYALGLSGFSNTYFSFDGGPGQIAIHGTNEPSSVGEYASHGCIRLGDSQITTLASLVEAGTPVQVVE
jgi:lipoprotein-anchoring transpeptidase ErfK/SrfK